MMWSTPDSRFSASGRNSPWLSAITPTIMGSWQMAAFSLLFSGSSRFGFRTAPEDRSAGAAQQLLVGNDADQDYPADHREIKRAWNAEQIDQVLKNLEQDRTEYHAENRAFPATQRTP